MSLMCDKCESHLSHFFFYLGILSRVFFGFLSGIWWGGRCVAGVCHTSFWDGFIMFECFGF